MTMTRSDAVEQPRSKRCTTPPPRWPDSAFGTRRLQVLLIDDEIEQLLPLADVLRRAGIAPTIATSDAEAIFDVRLSPPDVVVLGAEMAHRSLVSQIRALAPKLPLILMISIPSYDAEIAAMLALAGGFGIEKPVDPQRLLGLLSDHRRPGA